MPSFSFEGDQFLERAARLLEEAPRAIHDAVALDLERSLAGVIDQQFTTATDPQGVGYLAPKDGHSPPMQRSGALRAGIGVRCASEWGGVSVTVSSDRPYAAFLQGGTSRMAPRRIVPGSAMTSEAWRGAVRDAYTRAFNRWFNHE